MCADAAIHDTDGHNPHAHILLTVRPLNDNGTWQHKTEKEYRQLCENLDVAPEQTLMVGNSFRSDIAPALAAGAWALHIPYHVVWALEKSEEYPHEKLRKIPHFGEVIEFLKVNG